MQAWRRQWTATASSRGFEGSCRTVAAFKWTMAHRAAEIDAQLDEALEQTFPASDPAANTVETGIRIGELPSSSGGSVSDNRRRNQFELTWNGQTAFLLYRRTQGALTLIHTEVPPALRGHRMGETLVKAALEAARSEGLRVVAICPFVKAYLRKHPASS